MVGSPRGAGPQINREISSGSRAKSWALPRCVGPARSLAGAMGELVQVASKTAAITGLKSKSGHG